MLNANYVITVLMLIFSVQVICGIIRVFSNSIGTKECGQGQSGGACDAAASGARCRRRSSADFEFYYPGDLLSQVRVAGTSSTGATLVGADAPTPGPGSTGSSSSSKRRHVPPLLKRNTIADFANTRAYQESTASLISASDQGHYTCC